MQEDRAHAGGGSFDDAGCVLRAAGYQRIPHANSDDSTKAVKYSIAITTYTAINQAKRCIESVLANSGTDDFELILTANGSVKAAEYFGDLAAKRADVQLIVNLQNEGFIVPSNRALRIAQGELFVLLNDDCTVPERWLERLEKPFLDDPKCAISGARGGCCTLDENFVGHKGDRLDYIEGSCLMIRTELARKYGLFCEELKMAYGEDADMSLRYRQLGYTIHQADFALENHVAGTTAATVPGLAKIAQQNFALCRKRWAHYLKTRKFA